MPYENKNTITYHPRGVMRSIRDFSVVETDYQSANIATKDSLFRDDPGNLHIVHERLTPGVAHTFDYWGSDQRNWTEVEDWTINAGYYAGDDGHLFGRLDADLNELASKVLTKMNPSRPDVSLPVFLGEFRELPSQIYTKGRKALRENTRIGVQFGILPMVSDVLKLMRLSELTDKRMKMLKRLHRAKKTHQSSGMRTKKKIRSRNLELPLAPDDNGTPGLITRGSIASHESVWASAHWIPTDSYDVPELPEEMRSDARDLVLGLGRSKSLAAYAADTWELLPWSWFADWFGNFSDHIDQHLNQGVATCNSVWLMQHRFSTQTVFVESDPTIKQVRTIETKRRNFVQPTFSMSMPLLGNGQVSILTDIITSKRYRPSRSRSVGSPTNPE